MKSSNPRTIILDTFLVSSLGKQLPLGDLDSITQSDRAQLWVIECIEKQNTIVIPAICYYECIREYKRNNAFAQLQRLKVYCDKCLLPITNEHLELAADLWAKARNEGVPTAAKEALDCDVILAAQAILINENLNNFVVATTNVGHLSRFVPASNWQDITPGS